MQDEAFNALRVHLRSLAGPKMRATQRKALKRVGQMFEDSIKAKTPVRAGEDIRGGEMEPGELSQSIRARVSIASDEASVFKGKSDRVSIGPTGRTRRKGIDIKLIAHDVEYGHGNAAAVGFIREAFDTTKDAAVAEYQASVEEDLKAATK
jgi:hypothetical protein